MFNFKNIAIISLVLHILAAIFSTGFHHFDEHFQIIEFLNFKLGNIPASQLTWEYGAKMRPWFQIMVYMGMYKTFSLLGVSTPFAHIFIFRFFTSIMGFVGLFSMLPVITSWFKERRTQLLAWALLHLAWFIPYIQARTSSEALGIALFLMGFSIFVRLDCDKKNVRWYHSTMAGFLLGFAYLAKIQIAFMVAGLWFWAVVFKKLSLRDISLSALGILCVILLGPIIDYWGYGEWTFAAWNNYASNFSGGIMSSVKQYPWYWYFRWALLRGIPPVSLPILLATLWGWLKLRKHPLTWATIPLVLFHCYVGHKELRYVFPVIILSVLYLPYFIELNPQLVNRWWQKKWIRGVAKFCVGVNFLFLIIATFRPANPAPNFYKWIWNNPQIQHLQVLHEDPFTMLGAKLDWYKRPDIQVTVVKEKKDFDFSEKTHIFFNRGHIFDWENKKYCQLIYLSYPRWSLNFNISNWLSRSRVWSVFECWPQTTRTPRP